MEPWYLFSLAALVLLGMQRFLYKVAAERGCNSALTTAVFMATVTLLSSAVYFTTAASTQDYALLIILSLLNSAAFAFATIAHIEALRYLPASLIFPLTRLSLAVVILASVVWFGERLAPLQWLGVLLVVAVVAVLAKEIKGSTAPKAEVRTGLWFVGACILCGALASISSKLAADSISLSGFMALSYLFGTCFSLAIEKKWGKQKAAGRTKDAIMIGLVMGVLNFLGFYAFLSALSTGPLAAIALITGMHFVIAIVLSVWLYQEQMSLRRYFGIGLTLLAVIFLKQ